MNKQEMWDALVARHPDFKDPEHILAQRPRGLKRLIEQAWDEGFKAGKEAAPPPPSSDPLTDFLKAFNRSKP